MSAGALESALSQFARRRTAPSGRAWLEEVALGERETPSREAFLDSFVAAARRLGREPIAPTAAEARELSEAGVSWPLGSWSPDEIARIALLLRAEDSLPAPDFDLLLGECYARGDNRERCAVLRSLPLLAGAARFLHLGVEACRTHIQPLFEAIACENPYPADHFPELNFNQMVLKALFTGASLERIVGLEKRWTPELARMASAYASERRAAGRAVPPDAERLAVDPRSSP